MRKLAFFLLFFLLTALVVLRQNYYWTYATEPVSEPLPTPFPVQITIVPTAYISPGVSIFPTAYITPDISIAPITITPTPMTYWVSFGPKDTPDSSWDTAEELLDLLSSSGVEAFEINRWYGGWDFHVRNLPFNDFSIKLGEGYEIHFRDKPSITYLNVLPYISNGSYSPLKYNISAGWTSISIPSYLLATIGSPPTAEDLCQSINNQGGAALEIDYHELMPGPIVWTSHTCGNELNNFPVSSGKAYFIKATSYSSWILNPTIISPTPSMNKVSFGTPQVSLDADDFYLIINGQKFAPYFKDVQVHSDPGNPNYTTLELTWYENGIEMRMYIYFKSDGTNWWSEEVRTYNGNSPGDWIYYYGKFFESQLGKAYMNPTVDLVASPNNSYMGSIHFQNLWLKAFANYNTDNMKPTPTLTPTMPSSTPTISPSATPTEKPGKRKGQFKERPKKDSENNTLEESNSSNLEYFFVRSKYVILGRNELQSSAINPLKGYLFFLNQN